MLQHLGTLVPLMTGHDFPLQAIMDAGKNTTGHKMNQEREFILTQCLKIKSGSVKENKVSWITLLKKEKVSWTSFCFLSICWLTRFGVTISYGVPVCWKHPFSSDAGAGPGIYLKFITPKVNDSRYCC